MDGRVQGAEGSGEEAGDEQAWKFLISLKLLVHIGDQKLLVVVVIWKGCCLKRLLDEERESLVPLLDLDEISKHQKVNQPSMRDFISSTCQKHLSRSRIL